MDAVEETVVDAPVEEAATTEEQSAEHNAAASSAKSNDISAITNAIAKIKSSQDGGSVEEPAATEQPAEADEARIALVTRAKNAGLTDEQIEKFGGALEDAVSLAEAKVLSDESSEEEPSDEDSEDDEELDDVAKKYKKKAEEARKELEKVKTDALKREGIAVIEQGFADMAPLLGTKLGRGTIDKCTPAQKKAREVVVTTMQALAHGFNQLNMDLDPKTAFRLAVNAHHADDLYQLGKRFVMDKALATKITKTQRPTSRAEKPLDPKARAAAAIAPMVRELKTKVGG